jgi:hypothetical protein
MTRQYNASMVSLMNLVLIFFTIFVFPLMPSSVLAYVYPICFLLIFCLVSLSVSHSRRFHFSTVAFFALLFLLHMLTGWTWVREVFRLLEFIFFIYLLVVMVKEVAQVQMVSGQVIVDSITGYFLMGLGYANIVIFAAAVSEHPYNISPGLIEAGVEPLKTYIYYTFVTYTTTGYGDIFPTNQMTKSLAVLIAVSGQLYIAVIIAMLVGKYSSKRDQSP